jgi:hypothetical protein
MQRQESQLVGRDSRRRRLPVGFLRVALLHSVLRAEVGRLLDGFPNLEEILKSERCSMFSM